MSKVAMEAKAKKRIFTAMQIVLAVLVVAGAGWIAYKVIGYSQAQQVYRDMELAYADELDSAGEAVACPIDFAALQQDHPDVVAWLKMDDMDLSYAIVQGQDNDHYLYYDISDQPSIDGSIFLDYRNKSIADDKHAIVYGHNMMDESMFGQLDSYTVESFYRNGKGTFTIYTPQAAYRYQIFAVAIVDPTDDAYTTGFRNEVVFDSFVKGLKEKSMYEADIDVTGADYVVTLSTCSASDRLVLSAKRISAQPWTA